MKALDANVLVYAEISGSPLHAKAREVLATLAEGAAPWAIPWPCVYEFLRVVTHPRIYHPPMPIEVARADLDAILRSPSLLLLSETSRHREILDETLDDSGAKGNLLYDAHIVALCKEHGVSELITADRDFARFGGIKTTNPFAD